MFILTVAAAEAAAGADAAAEAVATVRAGPKNSSYYKKNWGFCMSYNDFKKLSFIKRKYAQLSK